MPKTQTFHIPGALRIDRTPHQYGQPVVYVCGVPNRSWVETDPKALLRAIKWPVKTPTGDQLREWLKEVEATKAAAPKHDAERIAKEGFGPEAHLDESDPNYATKTVI